MDLKMTKKVITDFRYVAPSYIMFTCSAFWAIAVDSPQVQLVYNNTLDDVRPIRSHAGLSTSMPRQKLHFLEQKNLMFNVIINFQFCDYSCGGDRDTCATTISTVMLV